MNQELTILIADEDAGTRSDLCRILKLDGYGVLAASCFAEARQMIATHSIHLVILDRQLPDGTAEQLLPEFRALLPLAPLVVITAYADIESTIAAFPLGADDYILKPVNADAMRVSVRRLLRLQSVEAELADSHRLTEQLLATAPALVWILDLEGKVVRFNAYFAENLGWKLGDVQGKDWFQHFVPDRDRERLRARFEEVIQADQLHGVVNRVLASDGSERQIRWSNSLLKDQAGEPVSVLAIGVDVTDLIAAQQQALRSERLAAIGQTLNALAHESRNGLQRIQASVEMLTLAIDSDSEARRDLDSIARAAKDLRLMLLTAFTKDRSPTSPS